MMPSTDANTSPFRTRPTPVGAWWHTAVLIVFICGFSLVQGTPQNVARESALSSRIPIYVLTLIVELGLFAYIWLLALRPRKIPIREIIGGKWNRFSDFLRDVGTAVVFWFAVGMVLLILQRFLRYGGLEAAKPLLPQTTAEMVMFLVLAVTAGFCEEFVFRGYLQRQFFALAGRAWIAIVLQAIVFGIAHFYQGWRAMVAITVYGALFGILAWLRGSLRPGMIQHGAQDSLAGIAAAILLKHKLI